MTILMALLALVPGPGDPAPLPRSVGDPWYGEEDEGEDEALASLAAAEAPFVQDGGALPQDPPQRPQTPLPPPEPVYPLGPPHASLTGYFRTHLSREAWETNVWHEYVMTPKIFAPVGLAAAAGIVHLWDKPIQKALKGALGDREWIGDASMAALLGGSLAAAVLSPKPGRSSWDALWAEGETFAVTAALTFGLKYAFPRGRPGGSGTDSFPSGHTSAAFMSASLIDYNLGDGWGAAAYGLAGLTGFSRVESDHHYLSDVLVGAAVGMLSAGIMEALHWGNGEPGHGIASARLEVEYLDRGGMVGLAFKF